MNDEYFCYEETVFHTPRLPKPQFWRVVNVFSCDMFLHFVERGATFLSYKFDKHVVFVANIDIEPWNMNLSAIKQLIFVHTSRVSKPLFLLVFNVYRVELTFFQKSSKPISTHCNMRKKLSWISWWCICLIYLLLNEFWALFICVFFDLFAFVV